MLTVTHGNRLLVVFSWLIAVVIFCLSSISVAQTAAPSTQPAIKVGITLSKLTGINKSPSGNLWGYNSQTRPVRELKTTELDFYPIIEIDSDKDEAFAAQLKKYYPNHAPISANQIDEIKKMDVLVTCECWMGSDDMLKALHESVSGGIGLLNIGGIGWASPGFRSNDQRTVQLAGLEEAQGGYTDMATTCEVVFDHAILGNLKQGQTIEIRPLGAFGILPPDMQPLIKVSDMTLVKTRGPAVNNPDYVFLPAYISHLEKGKIVSLQFGIGAINPADRADLMLRSIRFLAGRKVE